MVIMPQFETEEIQVCHACRMFLANGDLPNDFPVYTNWTNDEVDGEFDTVESVDADNVEWHPAHIHGDNGTYPSALGWSLSVNDGMTDEFSAYQCEACNAGPGARYPATVMRPAMKVEVHYSDDVYNEAGKLVDPWNKCEAEFEANPSAFQQSVTLICRDSRRADDDQTVLGSSWEVSEGFAYTVVGECAAGDVCRDLRAEGYDVTEDPNTVALHT